MTKREVLQKYAGDEITLLIERGEWDDFYGVWSIFPNNTDFTEELFSELEICALTIDKNHGVVSSVVTDKSAVANAILAGQEIGTFLGFVAKDEIPDYIKLVDVGRVYADHYILDNREGISRRGRLRTLYNNLINH